MRSSTQAFAAAALAAVLLTGCTAPAEPEPDAPDTTDGPAATAPAGAAPLEPATRPETSPSPTVVDLAQAKAAALAAGRPEAAWDRNCVAWELPDADTDAQQWANEVADTWLASHDADCPDAITFPDYYVQSFQADRAGELVVTLEDAALEDYYVGPRYDIDLQYSGGLVLQNVQRKHPELSAVRVIVEGTDKSATVIPES